MAKILLVDDDAHILDVLCFALEQEGHQVLQTGDGEEALGLLNEQDVDLMVIDVLMPKMSGLSLCREVRKTSDIPLIFLSSRDDESDKVLGLELGGDDYMTKPFSPKEFVARVAAMLRRREGRLTSGSNQTRPLAYGELSLDVQAHRLLIADEPVKVTAAEFKILQALLEGAGRVFSRPQLVERAFGAGHFLSDRTVDSHIRGLRKKLGKEGEVIETVYGVGYRLRDEA